MNKALGIIFLVLVTSFTAKSETDTIEVSFNKTIHVFFDSKVKYFDVGSPDVLIDSATNMVKLKAAILNFPATNLTVLTENGYHHFILVYEENPEKHIFHVGKAISLSQKKEEGQKGKKDDQADKNDDFKTACLKAKDSKGGINDLGVVGRKTKFLLRGIYVHDDNLYFVTEIQNASNIEYDIDFIRFVTRNNKILNSKKYAIQESVLEPLYVLNTEINTVAANSSVVKVFVFKKFTIASDKKLFLELWEKGGERQLNFSVDDADILNAKKL